MPNQISKPHATPLTPHASMWNWVCVRSAGFPAETVLTLAASAEVHQSIESLLQAEDEADHVRHLAVLALQQKRDESPTEQPLIQKALRQLYKKQFNLDFLSLSPLLAQYHALCQRVDALQTEFKQHLTADAPRLSQAIRTALQNEIFQEAIIWQNRQAYHQRIEWFLRQIVPPGPSPSKGEGFTPTLPLKGEGFTPTLPSPLKGEGVSVTNQRVRETERLLANYLQRYCVKNDTIGFFGPVGWGKLSAQNTTITYQSGNKLLAKRPLYFEHWGLNVLAQKLGQVPELRPWLSPRPLPFFYLTPSPTLPLEGEGDTLSLQGGGQGGGTLHLPTVTNWLRNGKLPTMVKDVFQLSPAQYRLLQLCDGKRLAKEIAAELLADSSFHLSSEAEVYQWLDQFCNWGVLRWTLELPMGLHSEQTLRHYLNRIADETLQRPALAALDELVAARANVAQAAGHAGWLNQAIGNLEDTFTRLTGLASNRAAGKYYAGRTLVYEDCQRDLTMSLGTDFLARLEPPLSLLLTSSRWFTYQLAQKYRQSFTTIYEQLVQQIGSPMIDFYSFSVQVSPMIQNDNDPIMETVIKELQQRWADILAIPMQTTDEPFSRSQTQFGNEKKGLTYRTEEHQSKVEAAFDAPHPGWNLARYCSPDVMIAAPSVEAMQQGHYQLILGELHLFNTLSRSCIVAQHPNPSELFAAREQDIPEPCIVPLPSKEWNTQRTAIALVSSKDVWFSYDTTPPPSDSPINNMVTLGELVVEQTDEGLRVRTRDQRLSFDIIEFFGYTLSNKCMAFPIIFPPAKHTPRLTIDEVVITRESWYFNISELPFVKIKERSAQFLAVRRWAKAHGLPRFLFVKSPNEPKPFYVDLASPIYVNILVKTIHHLAVTPETVTLIRLTEMLPTFDQLWLTDATNQRYTSELRLVIIN